MIGQNVANFIVMGFSSQASVSNVLELMTDFGNSNRINVTIEGNVENTNDVSMQIQGSEDGTTYNNIGSAYVVKPGGVAKAAISTPKYIRFCPTGVACGRIILSTDARTQHVTQLP